MSAFERIYRQRALTRKEEEQEQERARSHQERVVKRAKKEQAQHEDRCGSALSVYPCKEADTRQSRSNKFHHSGIAGIAYKVRPVPLASHAPRRG